MQVAPVGVTELAQNGQEVYERIKPKKPKLEKEHFGEYVVIEPESGDYEVAPLLGKGILELSERHPDKVFYSRHIGFLDKKRSRSGGNHDLARACGWTNANPFPSEGAR